MTIEADISGALAFLDEGAELMVDAARPAAQAGAQVLYDAVKRNVSALGRKTGKLEGSIYQKFSDELSRGGRRVYRISWNAKKAPHGHLVEFGFLQSYVMYQGNDGRVRPLVRPGMEGLPRPGRWATRAEKDAYYVPLPGGPKQRPGKAFVRSAASQFPKAQAAMEARYLEELRAMGVIR
ncbi:MAG: HK97 gp10 family phage protein [Rubrivivax sp.]|nr:MAG: HK97 gp10 family phage protein [Rubrivivax sp.]